MRDYKQPMAVRRSEQKKNDRILIAVFAVLCLALLPAVDYALTHSPLLR